MKLLIIPIFLIFLNNELLTLHLMQQAKKAVRENDIPKIAECLILGLDLNEVFENRTLLNLAIWLNKTEIVDYLIKNGADVNLHIEANCMKTPLMYAVSNNAKETDPAIITYLLDAKAKIEERNAFGETALIIAANTGQSQAVKLLLANKANIFAKNDKAETAFDKANQQYEYWEKQYKKNKKIVWLKHLFTYNEIMESIFKEFIIITNKSPLINPKLIKPILEIIAKYNFGRTVEEEKIFESHQKMIESYFHQ